LAQDVTRKLTTLFIQENDRSREEQDQGTGSFLAEQVQAAADRLKDLEGQVRDFKMRNLGALPEQQSGNLSILSGLQMQLQNTQAAEGRAREQQVYLQSLLTNYRELPPTMVPNPGAPGGTVVDPVTTLKAKLSQLKSDRAGLLARYTDKYPDVAKVDEEIKSTEAALAAAEKTAAETGTGQTDKGSTQSADASSNNATMAQVKSQLDANRLEVQNEVALEKQLQGEIAEYSARLNMTPVREQELAELNRNYELSKKNYEDLLGRKNASDLATSLDKHQKGQQFHIIDQPSLPEKPASPNHAAIALGGLGAGLALGVVLVFLLETKDHSLINEKELSRLFSFPLMVGMPALSTKAEVRRRSTLQKLEWFAGVALCLAVCATEFYIYRRG
jgi:polysaccharide chain length determinant protein (PEP-CTERM system associated)